MKKIICIIILLAVLKRSQSGWVTDEIGGYFNSIVEKSANGLIGNAKAAFRESMDYLFDNKIKPLLYQLEAAADRVIDKAKDDLNEVIDHFKKQMEDLIQTAAATAKKLVDYTIDEIRTKIINYAFDKLDSFESKLFRDITEMLNKVDAIMKNISCYAQAIIARITDEIKKSLPIIPNPFDKCRIKLDKEFPGQRLRYKFLRSFTPNQLYELRKCYLINNLTENSSINSINMAYRDLELLSGDMRCLSVSLGAIQNEKYYIKEMGKACFILDTLSNN